MSVETLKHSNPVQEKFQMFKISSINEHSVTGPTVTVSKPRTIGSAFQ